MVQLQLTKTTNKITTNNNLIMKNKLFYTLIVSVLILSSCNKNKVRIEGTITNAPKNSVLYISNLATVGEKALDSTILEKDGEFNFKLACEQTSFYVLSLKSKNINLLADPGDKITINSTAEEFGYKYQVKGSVNSGLMQLLAEKLYETQIQMKKLQDEFTVAQKSGNTVLSDTISKQYDKLLVKHKRFIIEFILQNLTSPISIAAVYQELEPGSYVLSTTRDLQYIKLVSDSLKKYYPKMPQVQALWTEREKLLTQYNERRLQAMVKGQARNYPEITLPDSNGKEQSLSSLDGSKVIILSFWACNDKNSNLMQADLMRLYNLYSSKGLKVYQVALNTEKEVWISALQHYQQPWINVIDLNTKSIAAGNYNLQNLPENFVIGKDGKIVGRDLAGNDLEKAINQQLR